MPEALLWAVGALTLASLLWWLGYRLGLKHGQALLDAYKEGCATDGGCWVKAQAEHTPCSGGVPGGEQ